MYIETSRCIIRGFTMDDASDLYKTLSDEKVMEYIHSCVIECDPEQAASKRIALK